MKTLPHIQPATPKFTGSNARKPGRRKFRRLTMHLRLEHLVPLLYALTLMATAPATAQSKATAWSSGGAARSQAGGNSGTHKSKTKCYPCKEWEDYGNGNGTWVYYPEHTAPTVCPGDTANYSCKECDGKGEVRNKSKPPQSNPDPDDKCGEYKWDTCEWKRKTPDCKRYEEQVSKMQLIIYQLWARLKALEKPAVDAETCCACNNGDNAACAAAVTRNIWPCPSDACTEADRFRQLRSSLIHMLNVSIRDLKVAKQYLDECRKCKR